MASASGSPLSCSPPRYERVVRRQVLGTADSTRRPLGETKLRDVTVDLVAVWSQANEQALAPSTAKLALSLAAPRLRLAPHRQGAQRRVRLAPARTRQPDDHSRRVRASVRAGRPRRGGQGRAGGELRGDGEHDPAVSPPSRSASGCSVRCRPPSDSWRIGCRSCLGSGVSMAPSSGSGRSTHSFAPCSTSRWPHCTGCRTEWTSATRSA